MEYRAVKNRCAIDIHALKLPIPWQEAKEILIKYGFKIIRVDIISLARKCIQISKYKYGAKMVLAPEVIDCSSIMKWLFAQRGIWIPRRVIQQYQIGETILEKEFKPLDLLFISGRNPKYFGMREDIVGHTGIVTDDNTVIHAMNEDTCVIEESIDSFLSNGIFYGAKRIIPDNKKLITLEIPEKFEIETSDDIKWFILRKLK